MLPNSCGVRLLVSTDECGVNQGTLMGRIIFSRLHINESLSLSLVLLSPWSNQSVKVWFVCAHVCTYNLIAGKVRLVGTRLLRRAPKGSAAGLPGG